MEVTLIFIIVVTMVAATPVDAGWLRHTVFTTSTCDAASAQTVKFVPLNRCLRDSTATSQYLTLVTVPGNFTTRRYSNANCTDTFSEHIDFLGGGCNAGMENAIPAIEANLPPLKEGDIHFKMYFGPACVADSFILLVMKIGVCFNHEDKRSNKIVLNATSSEYMDVSYATSDCIGNSTKSSVGKADTCKTMGDVMSSKLITYKAPESSGSVESSVDNLDAWFIAFIFFASLVLVGGVTVALLFWYRNQGRQNQRNESWINPSVGIVELKEKQDPSKHRVIQ